MIFQVYFLFDVFGDLDYKFDCINSLLIGLFLKNVTNLLINFNLLRKKLFLIVIALIENIYLLDLNFSVFGSDHRNALNGAKQSELFILGTI